MRHCGISSDAAARHLPPKTTTGSVVPQQEFRTQLRKMHGWASKSLLIARYVTCRNSSERQRVSQIGGLLQSFFANKSSSDILPVASSDGI